MAKKAKDNTEETAKKTPTPETAAPETPEAEAQEAAAGEKDTALADAIAELDKTKDLLLRTAAEYDNFRRRSQREKDALYADSKADVLTKLLPVLDNFERAAAAETEYEQYRKGIDMTVGQLLDTMKSLGAEGFGLEGEPFDPNMHNAVMHVEDESLGESVVAQVFIKGYKIGDRVIRPASVKVAN